MLRIPAVVAACVAVLLVASACTDDEPEPNFSSVYTSPTPSVSPTPTPSSSISVPSTGPNVNPGEVAPTEPGMALVDSAEGAQAFASYYFQTLDWSYATNSSELMDDLFAPTCDNCSKLTANLTTTFARGEVTGARVMIKRVAVVTNDGRGGASNAVSGVVDISAGQIAEGGGFTPIAAEPDVTITLWVAYSGARWQVVSQAKV